MAVPIGLCVNFTEIKDALIAGHTLFLGVSIRMFPEEIDPFESVHWIKKVTLSSTGITTSYIGSPHECGETHPSTSIDVPNRKNMKKITIKSFILHYNSQASRQMKVKWALVWNKSALVLKNGSGRQPRALVNHITGSQVRTSGTLLTGWVIFSDSPAFSSLLIFCHVNCVKILGGFCRDVIG